MADPHHDQPDVGDRHAEDVLGFEGHQRRATSDHDRGSTESSRDDLRDQEAQATAKGEGETKGDAADQARSQERTSARWTTRVVGRQPEAGKRKKGRFVRSKLRRWVIGGIIVTVFSIIIGAASILPNKLDGIIQQMEHRFYSRIEQYVEARTDRLLFRYLAVYVFGNNAGIQTCAKEGKANFTVRDSCFYRTNPARGVLHATSIGRAILAWKERRLESTLAPVEITYEPNARMPNGTLQPRWRVTVPTGETALIDPKDPSAGTRQMVQTTYSSGGTRTQKNALQQAVMTAVKRETRSNVITRMIASVHLKNKYGLRRCVLYCEKRQRIDETKLSIRKAWQGVLADRIVGGTNARAGLFMSCMFQGSRGCTEDNPEYRAKYKDVIAKLEAKYGAQKVDDFIKVADEYAKYKARGGNFTKFAIDTILGKISNKIVGTSASAIINIIPIIGQAIYGVIVGYEILTVVLLFYNIYTWANSPAAQYASTAIKAGTYTAAYGTLETANDESRAVEGDVFSITARGAESETVNPANSFMFNALYANPAAFTNFGALFAKTAYAGTEQQAYPYVCDSKGTKMEKDQVVCPNWRFDEPNPVSGFAKSLPGSAVGAALASNEVTTAVQDTANSVVATIDTPFNAASAFAYDTATPQGIKNWLNTNMGELSESASNHMFAPPFTDAEDVKDAKLYDAAHLGVDWTVNDVLRGGLEDDGKQFGYGARVASAAEVKRLDTAYEEQLKDEYDRLSWSDKLLSKDHPSSFVNQLALAMPSDLNQSISLFKPSTAMSLLGTIFGGRSASALAPAATHGGIPQYVFGSELYTNPMRSENDTKPCPNTVAAPDGNLKKIGNTGTADYGLGRAEFKLSNTCQLDEMVARSNTAYFTNEPLDPSLVTQSATSSTVTPGSGNDRVTGKFDWPIAASDFAGTTSCYGPRSGGFHYGVDMVGKRGDGRTRVIASDGGTVVAVNPRSQSAGGFVALRHGKNSAGKNEYTLYMHMYPDLGVSRVGQTVQKGQFLGRQGNFGQSFGSHVHFTYAVDQPVNSSPFAKNPTIVLPNRSGNGCG